MHTPGIKIHEHMMIMKIQDNEGSGQLPSSSSRNFVHKSNAIAVCRLFFSKLLAPNLRTAGHTHERGPLSSVYGIFIEYGRFNQKKLPAHVI